tara:strand:- start:31 stop:438 length:408 start_codon:yes stop_codon:yes gene_type:complete
MVFAEQMTSVQDRLDGLLAEAHESCEDDGGVLKLSGDEVVQYDFDNDSSIDLTILNELEYNCSSSASLFKGTAGAVVHLITDVDYSYGYARQYEYLKAFNDVPTILLNLHGTSCGEAGFVPCVSAISIHDGRFVK